MDGVYGPLLLVSYYATFSELSYWKLFFPAEKVSEIITFLNE